MEFAQQLFSMLDEESRARLVYKPSKGLKNRVMRRLTPLGENFGSEKQRFFDIEFIVGEERQSFHGLRFVFGSLSPWFEERLYSNGGCSQLELPEITVEAFQCIFNGAYGMDPPITLDNVLSVLEAAQMTGVNFLSGECLGLLAQNITAKNVLDVFNTALDQDMLSEGFERRCCRVILKRSRQVMESPAFLKISPQLMAKLVECDFFFVDEIALWRRLVSWAKTKAAEDLESKDSETPMGEEEEFNVGDRVILVNGNVGTIAYKGTVDFGPGIWFGIDLRDAVGDTSGAVDDRTYFEASRPTGAVFVRVSNIGAKVPEGADEQEVTCMCGGELSKLSAKEAGGGNTIRCTVCSVGLGNEDRAVFHCPRGRVKAHPVGFDMCEKCFDKKNEMEAKEAEMLRPSSRDVQYLRQVIPYLRFPTMPTDFFLQKIAPLLPRPMADSVLMSHISSTLPCMFPTQPREVWSAKSGNELTYTVVAANCELAKAQSLNAEGDSQWSHLAINTHEGGQWFIIDASAIVSLTSVDLKNHYGDGDTIKDINLYALDPTVEEWTEEENEGDKWIAQGSFQSKKTSNWQRDISVSTTIAARWWKFHITTIWGNPDNYTCLNNLRLHGSLEEDADDDEDELEARLAEISYDVLLASQEVGKAKKLPVRDASAEWSGTKMAAAGGAQWFVVDLKRVSGIGKLELKHRYADNDTIKDMEIFYLPEDVQFTSDEKGEEGGNWVKATEILSAQTTDVQNFDLRMDAGIKARFWKFNVLSVYGGGLTADNYPCMNYMVIFVKQEMWTTGLAKVEE